MKKLILIFFLIFNWVNCIAQWKDKYCATDVKMKEIYKEHPELLSKLLLEEKLQESSENNLKKSAGVVYVIPVVVHVVHNGGPENISDAQVRDGIRILNEDFRKMNADTSQIVPAFQSIAADSEIEFRLAQKDPNGNCTNGIVRQQTFMTNDPNGQYELAIKADIWPVNMYLNIWTANDIGGAAGYAYLPPSGGTTRDGIMILHDYFGSIGTAWNDGRALTHETGHYLGLYHTWGPGNDAGNAGNCSIDDGVGDTPNTIGNFGCNLTAVSCSSLDNIQNYMDYTSCGYMFTQGQKARMGTRLTNSSYGRTNLWTASNLIATGTEGNDILCAADFSSNPNTICMGTSVSFYDESYNGQVTTWNWSFPGGTPGASADSNPVITYNTSGVYDVSLTVGNGIDNASTTKISYINVMVPQAVPFLESFESVTIPGSEWEIINNDNGNTWGLTTAASYSGSASLKMNNYSGNTAGQTDEAINSTIDLSVMNSAQFTFKVAYAQKNSTTNDVLWTFISNNCGNNWSTLVVKSGSNLSSVGYRTSSFIPTDTSEWNEISVAIGAAFLTENFRFKFKFTSAEGNNLYIDDININTTNVPILISPPNYTTGLPINVTIDWNAVAGVAYHQYEIDTSLLFSSPMLVSGTKQYISSTNDNPDTEHQLTNSDTVTTYYWRVRAIAGPDTLGWSSFWRFTTGSTVGIDDYAASNLNLLIFPNPIESYSVIYFNLHKSQYVTLKVYDILGREILNLADEKLDAGTYRFETKEIENPGIYLVKLTAGEQVFTKKIIKFNF